MMEDGQRQVSDTDCAELPWSVYSSGEPGMPHVHSHLPGKPFALYWLKERILFCSVSWFEELHSRPILEGSEKGFADDHPPLAFTLEERFLFCPKSGFVDCLVIEGCTPCPELGLWGLGDRNASEGEIEDVSPKRSLLFVVLLEWTELEEEWYG